jgi:hypothetical protein
MVIGELLTMRLITSGMFFSVWQDMAPFRGVFMDKNPKVTDDMRSVFMAIQANESMTRRENRIRSQIDSTAFTSINHHVTELLKNHHEV